MSRFSPYLELKRTNLDYLEEAPAHWLEMQLCRAVSFNDEVVQEDLDGEERIRYVDISSVSHIKGITQAAEMKFSDAPSRARRKAKEGDVVVSTVRTYLKAVAQVTYDYRDCIYSTGFAVLRARPNAVHSDYLKWLMLNESLIQSIEAHSEGLSYPAINASELVKLKAVFPPINEQLQISSFLEREAARIDTLIAKKTRLIELLKEKRQAVITKAVTKGLDDSVQMRDSGEEWIGAIPKHWSSVKFNFVARVTEGLVDPKDPPYRDMVLVAPNHIESGTGRLLAQETAAEQNAESGKYTCKQGAVIYSKIRPALAKVVIAPCDCLCSADMYPMNCSEKTNPEWLFYLMLSAPFTAWAVLESDRVAMPKINRESLSGLRAFVPPLEEQRSIVDYVNARLARIDRLILKTERSIELLKEHRAALITAAVTGKIDVREAA